MISQFVRIPVPETLRLLTLGSFVLDVAPMLALASDAKLFEKTMMVKYGPENVKKHFAAFDTICDATQVRPLTLTLALTLALTLFLALALALVLSPTLP